MNISDSECSSGCESGWTVYLDHSFSSENASQKRPGKSGAFCETRRKEKQVTEEEEEEEDLSMVSDASSGPPHFHDQEEEEEEGNKPCYASKRQRMKEKPFACGDQDDTASSPLFGFSDMEDFAMTDSRGPAEGVVDYSQGFSATHFQRRGRSFGFLHSPFSGKQMSDLKGIRR